MFSLGVFSVRNFNLRSLKGNGMEMQLLLTKTNLKLLHGNFELRPLGVAMGNVIPTPPCWGECKPNSRRGRALVNSTIWLRELPLWTVDAVSDIIPFGQKPELHTWSTYLLGAGITGPRVELTGLESVL